MDATTNKQSNDDLKSCIITTGIFSLHYYNERMKCFDNSFLYNYMGASSIKNIAKAPNYYVIIDFQDKNIREIVFELLNYLLSLNAILHVKAINIELSSEDNDECIILLNRLERHNLINLEIINEITDEPKEKEENSWMKKLKNTFFFTGSGNTGKTSLISALSELCSEKGHTVALIDLTETMKLANYFTHIYSLNSTNLKEAFKFNVNEEKPIHVYNYQNEGLKNFTELREFCYNIERISKDYDYVFVNADMKIVNMNSEIFNIGEKVFIVNDLMPININSTKQILLRFEKLGINTKGNISLIYNKTIKCCLDIGSVEEKIIFKKSNDKKLVPIIDINCETFEIPYSKTTMKALINRITNKSSIINNVSYSYSININNIYKYINNTPYVEVGDVDFVDYLKNIYHNIKQHTYIRNATEEVYNYIEYVKELKKSAAYLIHSKILQKL